MCLLRLIVQTENDTRAMSYDIFISYSRRDNSDGRITNLVKRIEQDFEDFAERPLVSFFDVDEIKGMDDWRHRILKGLQESRLFLACISPDYLKSTYCEWEFNEFLNHEIAKYCTIDGVAPIYFVEVPEWDDHEFEDGCADWIARLRERQSFDLRPWYHEGESSLRKQAVADRLKEIGERLYERVRRGEHAEQSIGNIERPNPHFVGRQSDVSRLHATAGLGRPGVITILNGLGGIGKTALATQYAYWNEYSGGRWQIPCEGVADLRIAFASLRGARDMQFDFSAREEHDLDLQFERVIGELKNRALSRPSKRCLVILDNVDRPELLAPDQTRRLPQEDWMRIIVTTRLGETEFPGEPRGREFLSVDELSRSEGVQLIRDFQPSERVLTSAEETAILRIVDLLGGFTVAVECAAVYLSTYSREVSFESYAAMLEDQGLEEFEERSKEVTGSLRYGEHTLTATLCPAIERLGDQELQVLVTAALLPPDYVVLPWLRELFAESNPEFGLETTTGVIDPWGMLIRRLLSSRLLKGVGDSRSQVVKVHRLVQEIVRTKEARLTEVLDERLGRWIRDRLLSVSQPSYWGMRESDWEVDGMVALASLWLSRPDGLGVEIAAGISRALIGQNRSVQAFDLLQQVLPLSEEQFGRDHPVTATCLNNTSDILGEMKQFERAESYAREALSIDRRHFAEPHWRVARDLNNLGLLFQAQDRVDDAADFYNEALSVITQCELSDPLNSAQDAIIRLDIADLDRQRGLLDESLVGFRSALAALKNSLGETHPYVAATMNNIAVTQHDAGYFEEAEESYRMAIQGYETRFGPNDLRVATTLHHYGIMLHVTGRPKEAAKAFERTLEILDTITLLEGRDDVKLTQALEWYVASVAQAGYSLRRIRANKFVRKYNVRLTYSRYIHYRIYGVRYKIWTLQRRFRGRVRNQKTNHGVLD